MKKHGLVKNDIYGFPLYYRIEYRKITTGKPPPENESKCETTDTADSDVYLDIPITEVAEKSIRPTLVISYRKEVDGILRMLYEGTPISGQDVVNWLAESKSEFPDLNDLSSKTKQKFLSDFIGKDAAAAFPQKLSKAEIDKLNTQREERLRRRKEIEELTFGIMFLADEKLLDLSDDDKRVIPRILECAGRLRWREAIPKKFEYLVESSEHERKQVKRIMRSFFTMQTAAGICEENPWLEYDATPNRSKYLSGESYIKKYIEPVSLTEKQRFRVFETCRNRLKNGSVTGIDIAVLLVLTLKMDENEISALYLEDFEYLKYSPNRLAVTVTHCVQKVNARYVRRDIQDPYERRKLPVISLIRECWEYIRKKHKVPLGSRKQINPLVPSKLNNMRREDPLKVKKAIEEYIKTIVGLEFTKITDIDGKVPSVIDMLKTTARQQMQYVHLEDEEIRAILGMHPKRVSGRSYYDRFNDGALNKIGALLDRSTNIVAENTLVHIKKGKVIRITARDPEHCVNATCSILLEGITYDCIPEEGIELEFFSYGGMSGYVYFEKRED